MPDERPARPSTAYPQPPAVFHAEPASPDTVELSWGSAGPVLVESVSARPGDEVVPGDTLALGRDSLVGLEIEMVLLQLSLASAGGAAETEIARLEGRLAALEAASRKVLAAPAAGNIAWMSLIPGASCPPGRPCAGLATLPESMFVLRSREGTVVQKWPESGNGASLVHASADSAVYSGIAAPGDFVFDGSLGLPRTAILDTGLESFVISSGGDTIPVERLCSSGDVVTVIADAVLDGGVQVWSGSLEEWND